MDSATFESKEAVFQRTNGVVDETAPPASVQDLTCLVLDDDPHDAKYLCDLLAKIEQFNIRFFVAHDLVEARRLCAVNKFDLFFVDFWMGYETTISFVDEIRTEEQPSLTVMLSTFDESEFLEICKRAGAADFISKNELDVDRLENIISQRNW